MKKQYVSLLAILLSVCGFYSSCDNKMNRNTGALEFDSIQINKTGYLFSDTTKPGSNLIITFTYPAKSSDNKLKDSLNTYFLSACFGDKYLGENIREIVTQYADTYFKEYRQDLEPMFLEDEKNRQDGESIESWYSYYKTIESSVTLYNKDLLVYRINYSEYTGGAHGIYTSTFLNMNLKTIHPLMLDDLFVGEYKEALTDLLWNQLMADHKVTTRSELEDMGYGSTGDLVPTENFYLDKEGITFFYNVYEFTPYVMGTTEIKLLYEQLEHMLGSEPIIGQLRK